MIDTHAGPVHGLVIIDTETSGLDPATCHLVEVAAVIYDAVLATVVSAWSGLIAAEGNAASAINGISPEALRTPAAYESPWPVLRAMDQRAASLGAPPVYVAHRAEFDRGFLPELPERRWICSKLDAEWPRGEAGGGLVHTALAHGIGVSRAHRAIEDCLTLAALLTRTAEIEGSLEPWLQRATEPRVEVVGRQAFDENQLAKDAGFQWDSARKVWHRSYRESVLADAVAQLSFKTEVIDGNHV